MPREILSNGEPLVMTPSGMRPRSLISFVPKGMRLHVESNREVVAIDANGYKHRFDPPSAEALAWLNDPRYPERRTGRLTGIQPGSSDAEQVTTVSS